MSANQYLPSSRKKRKKEKRKKKVEKVEIGVFIDRINTIQNEIWVRIAEIITRSSVNEKYCEN